MLLETVLHKKMTFPNEKIIHYHKNQDYNIIKKECLKNPKRLWEDLSYKAIHDERVDWDWKRPGEIMRNARFIKIDINEAPSRFNINNLNTNKESVDAGVIKYNLALLSALTLNLKFFRWVVPEDNEEFSNENYTGVFHFRFWRYGKLYDIVVDDYLPTCDGKLVSFLRNGHPEEFWPILLEKAYAKLCGSSESLNDIAVPDLIVDLTGGVFETIIYLGHETPLLENLNAFLSAALERESLIIFGRYWQNDIENVEFKNLHCITKAVYINNDSPEQELMLRIFTPFITEPEEGKGPESEDSKRWLSTSEAMKDEIGIITKHEFVMPLSEFKKHDWNIYIVNLNPFYINNCANQTKIFYWYSTLAEGKCVKGVSSGGNLSEYRSSTFYLNPQYKLSLTCLDSTDFKHCTGAIIISLLQKTHKNERIPMVLYIFELEKEPEERLGSEFFKNNSPIIDSFPYIEARETTKRLNVPPGEYCVVVAPNRPYHEGRFLLRVFAEQSITLNGLHDKVARKYMDVQNSLTSPLNEHQYVQESDKRVSAYFEEVSGEGQVVKWKGLKKVLDFAMANEKSKYDSFVGRNSLVSYMFPSISVFDTIENNEFSKDVTRSLLATADIDHSGKLTLQEFQGLWSQIRQWMLIYEMYSDDNGYLPKQHLREALDSAGFQLNSDILSSFTVRYSNRDNIIPFDDFLICASKLKTVFDYYRYKDPEYTNVASFTLEEWLQKSVYS